MNPPQVTSLQGLLLIPKGAFQSWHDELRCFIVHDEGSKERVGHFYLDLHPRDGKVTVHRYSCTSMLTCIAN